MCCIANILTSTNYYTNLFFLQVWNDAGTQIFYSYAVALGGMIALGSYNKFNNNFVKQCVFLVLCNSGTSLFAGLGIFSVLGFMSQQLELPMEKVAEKGKARSYHYIFPSQIKSIKTKTTLNLLSHCNLGPGLAFIAYPKAMASMPLAPLWSALFFAMILLVGLDSQFVQVESVVTAIVDLFPNFLRRGKRREILVGVVCLVDFFIGCTMVMEVSFWLIYLWSNVPSKSKHLSVLLAAKMREKWV